MDKLRRQVIILPNRLPRRGRGGSGNDRLFGCAGKNTLSSGGFDVLSDVGGTEVTGVAIPESDYLYTGFPIEPVSYVSLTGRR